MGARTLFDSQGIGDPWTSNIVGLYSMTCMAYHGSAATIISMDLKTYRKKRRIFPLLTYPQYQFCVEDFDGLSDKFLRFLKMFYRRGGAETAHILFIWDKDVFFLPRKIIGKLALYAGFF